MDNLEADKKANTVIPTETDAERIERRHREQEEGKKIIAERERNNKLEAKLINTYIERAKEDPTTLYSLYDDEPELANKVASKFTRDNGSRYSSFQDYADSLKNDSKPVFNNSKEEFKKWYLELRQEEQFEQSKTVYLEEFKNLSDDDQEKAIQEYSEMFGNQPVAPEEARKRAKLIARAYNHRVTPNAPISPSGGNYIAPRAPKDKIASVHKDAIARMGFNLNK